MTLIQFRNINWTTSTYEKTVTVGIYDFKIDFKHCHI